MVYLVTAARADFSAQHIQWTPLAHHCGCVVAWGWRTDADSPFDFIMWCCRIIGEPCPWHCLNLVDSVKVLQQSTVMAGSADGVCTWLAAQARNVDAELGRTLSAQLQSLLTKITSVPDIAELAHEIPEKDRKRAADNGYDPIDDWIEHQLIDIILNHGFSVRAYIEQVAKARQRSAVHHTTVATEPSRPETSPHAQGCRTSGKRGARANPSRPKTRPRIPVAEMRKLCERSAGRCAFTNCNLELSAVQTEHDPAVSLGEIAHIVAWTPEGPRGQSQLDARERNRYENLILLCGHHHRLVDRQPHTYTVDALHEMKAAHERRINQLISGSGAIPDPARWLVDANGAFPCMSTVDNRALLGIHPAIELSGDADSLSDQFPTYIGRDFDPLLRQKVQECSQSGGLIVLVGQAASGKSRSAFEAVRAVLPQWRLVVPASSHDLTEFVSAEGDLAKCVIWLDKLAEFLAPGELASRTVQRLITGSGGPTLLIGGLWPTEYDRIRHNNSGHFDHRPHGEVTIEQPSVHRDGRRILDFAVRVELAREFSTSEQSRAKAVAALDPRVAEAVRQEGDHAIASMLAAAPELIHRWRQPSDPVGGQLVSAAIEARLCWHPRRLPVDLLKALTEQRLSTAQKARLDENWFTRALAWACQPVRGDVAALTAHAESIGPAAWYEVSDVLVGDAAHRIFTKERLKVDWDCLLTHAGSSACASIGAFAMHYDVLPRAAQAWRKAIDGGVPGLESLLAITLFDLDDLSGARQWYERAVRCGTLETADIPMLAVICEEMGEPDARDHWLQLAADAGDPAAWWAQGRIAEEEGDDETAAVKYLKAVEFGDPGGNALNSLGVQLSRRDDRTGARHYYQRAIDEHDHPHAMLNLGLMLGQEGDEQGSISLIYRAALADIPEAAARIGELLRADGDDAGAVTWLQRAAEHGVVNAIAGLAGVLWKTGHTQQAQQWFILGIKQGDLACTFGLGMLLDALGETETARGLLSTAAHRGQPGAAGRYALFLVENGDYSSAKEWLQQAHDEGDPLAAVTATMWAHRAN